MARNRPTVKDIAGRLGGWGMALFARLNPDTPGKLAMHAYSYEHMELAAYELLRRFAERAQDEALAQLAERIGGQERSMADRIAEHWDRAVDASLRAKGAEDLQTELVKYLRDAHALEAQAIQMLEAGSKLAEFSALAEVMSAHLDETRGHQRLIDERLQRAGLGPGALPGRGDAGVRAQPRRVLQGPAGHAGQAGGLRLRVRGARVRRVRAAQAHGPARGRRRDRGHGRDDPERGAPRGRAGRGHLGRRGRDRARGVRAS